MGICRLLPFPSTKFDISGNPVFVNFLHSLGEFAALLFLGLLRFLSIYWVYFCVAYTVVAVMIIQSYCGAT